MLGSQTDEDALRRAIAAHGVPQVVVDDGSHVPADVVATFGILFPLLPDGAIYAIEDTQTSYWPEWGGEEDPAAADRAAAAVGLVSTSTSSLTCIADRSAMLWPSMREARTACESREPPQVGHGPVRTSLST